MRTTVLLTLTLVLPAVSIPAQAATQQAPILFAQRILSCGEQASTLYLQYTGLKCNTRSPSQPDKCKPLMTTICTLAEKCERAKAYCIK